MSTKRMLLDAAHPEETRVAIVENSRLLDHDVEVAARRQLKGNIYLAKVTRVEPSLQAAFVDYGGNRHGFLAFNEIHPDYYQIPVADREALIAEQQAAEAEDDEEHDEDGSAAVDEDDPEVRRPRLSPRHYKIQEVIKRRQVMLVQVAKEERGNKGAALTTYLSLAGRYCVLMPNTTRGGGISRKITNVTDRKRLKKIVAELELPEGMAVILRTAGSERNKAEIKRDYEYLMRLWSNIRELTLSSMAPMLVYEEGSLIKRSIRDLYDRAIEEILVEGEAAYRTAKDFMKLFIPSHAKRVKLYDDARWPLFHRYGVESELEAMHTSTVELKSGGSIVINPTEALVSIDVNSGRATRERHIEETALRTNVEACDEIARQLRLRDLAGLIVIDFIDMEVSRNQSQVERRLKEAMKNDRARVQFGRISAFGLLELSRQRLRPSLWETSYEICEACGGTGVRRSVESAALSVLRSIEAEGVRDSAARVIVTVPTSVALYLLNQKRRTLLLLEERHSIEVVIQADNKVTHPVFEIERAEPAEEEAGEKAPATAESEKAAEEKEESGRRSRRRRPRRRRRPDEEATVAAAGAEDEDAEDAEEGADAEAALAEDGADAEAGAAEEGAEGSPDDDQEDAEATSRKRRRRGKRGGRRRTKQAGDAAPAAEGDEAAEAPPANDEPGQAPFAGVTTPETLLEPTLLEPPVVHGALADHHDVAPETETPVIFVSSGAEAEIGPAVQPEPEEAAESAAAVHSDEEPPVEPIVAPEEPPSPEAAASDMDAGDHDETAETSTAPDDGKAADDHALRGQPEPSAARTTVINVGDHDADADDGRRRGWWERLLS